MAKMKLKTNRSDAKRLKVTGSGKVMRRKGWKGHLLSGKNATRKRRLSGSVASKTFLLYPQEKKTLSGDLSVVSGISSGPANLVQTAWGEEPGPIRRKLRGYELEPVGEGCGSLGQGQRGAELNNAVVGKKIVEVARIVTPTGIPTLHIPP